jgi:hypothetical protein
MWGWNLIFIIYHYSVKRWAGLAGVFPEVRMEAKMGTGIQASPFRARPAGWVKKFLGIGSDLICI